MAKKLKLASAQVGAQAEGAEEDVTALSDEDVTKLVGTFDSCKLEVIMPNSAVEQECMTLKSRWMRFSSLK